MGVIVFEFEVVVVVWGRPRYLYRATKQIKTSSSSEQGESKRGRRLLRSRIGPLVRVRNPPTSSAWGCLYTSHAWSIHEIG